MASKSQKELSWNNQVKMRLRGELARETFMKGIQIEFKINENEEIAIKIKKNKQVI